MTDLVRSAVLSNYAEVAHSVGLDPYQMLARVGLQAACLSERDLKIPTTLAAQLLEDSAALSGVGNFGLRMAETRRLSVLGHLGVAARDAPTLRHLLTFLMQHMRLHNESLHMYMEDLGDSTFIRQVTLVPGQRSVRQSVELTLGALVRIIKVYLGDEWQPQRACFMHPVGEDTLLHRRMFGQALEFGAEMDALVCKREDLDRPLASSDPVMASYASRLWNGGLDLQGRSIQREVRQLILILLPDGRCSIERVAKHMGVGRQTVHRKLAQDGVQFSDLTNEIRTELSDRYLSQSNRPLGLIALLLGFSELSGYSRWHQKLLGESPSARRKQLLVNASAQARVRAAKTPERLFPTTN